MGFKLLIDGREYTQSEFSVSESATPLAAGDSSGSVGTFSITIPDPDEYLQPSHPIVLYGPNYLVGKPVRLEDSRKGFTLGSVTSANNNLSSGTIAITVTSRLGDLNVFDVQAQPFVGRLGDAFQHYLSLAGITSGFQVDPTIAARSVVFPGWHGELWFNLKQMMTAVDCDISLVSGIIVLRPVRGRVATRGRDLDRTFQVGGGSLAQSVEVYQYNNRQITNEMVYPPGGWSPEVTVFNVNAGETIEETLELSASVSSIQQPTIQTFVSQNHTSSSVFTVVGDDGLPITPAAWNGRGGSLRVEINPDTTSLTLHVTAPDTLPNRDGQRIEVYGISLSASEDTGRYSTLRILGSGVAFDKQPVRVPTGLTLAETGTEVGVTIDNPFMRTKDDVMRAGMRAIRGFNGSAMNISGSVISINRLGDDGERTQVSYGAEAATHAPGSTYATVAATYAGMTYRQVAIQLNEGLNDEFENQVFGNVNSTRVWDKRSARWYRIREGTLSPDRISFQAEDDLLNSDVATFETGNTYSAIQSRYTGMTYREVDVMGLR